MPPPQPVRIWDLPTRAFHWSLVLAVVGAFVTGKLGGGWIVWHERFGLGVLALLLFRLGWGFFGGRWSRFVSFIYGPGSLWRHLRGQSPPEHTAGHSPLGALSVFAMLGVLLIQAGSGLFTDDEIAFTGPLNRFVSSAQGLWLTGYHKDVGQWLLVALVSLHLAAVLAYWLIRRNNLTAAMVHGDKLLEPALPPSQDTAATRVVAAVWMAGCAAFVYWVATLGG